MVAVGEAILDRAREVGQHIQELVEEVLCAENAPAPPIGHDADLDGSVNGPL